MNPQTKTLRENIHKKSLTIPHLDRILNILSTSSRNGRFELYLVEARKRIPAIPANISRIVK
jgi:hypothetical protein